MVYTSSLSLSTITSQCHFQPLKKACWDTLSKETQIFINSALDELMLVTISGRTFLRGVQGNPNKFPILVQGDAVHGIPSN